MKIQELSRTTTNGEVRSTYEIGNLTVHLTSHFNNKIELEDAMYEIILQRLRSQSQERAEGRCNTNGKLAKDMV